MSLSTPILVARISPPLEKGLSEQLVEEFASLERNYVLGEWEPATLDAGQFTEAAARILFHQDSGVLSPRKSVAECLSQIERDGSGHRYPDRKSALHTTRVLRLLYKFRSDRGAVHIDPVYTANHIDAKLVIECARWVLAELLRIFWRGSDAEVVRAIREIADFEVPAVGKFGERLLVQRTDCTTQEEILILLHHAGNRGMTRAELGQGVNKAASSVTEALKQLESSTRRQVVRLSGGTFQLTALGSRRVIRELAPKLVSL